MFKIICLFLCSSLTACSQQRPFVDFEKWQIPDRGLKSYLKGQPEEIKCEAYGVSDTTLYSKDHKMYEETYRLNREGAMIRHTISFDSGGFIEQAFSFGPDGRNWKIYRSSDLRKDPVVLSSSVIPKRKGPNSFLLTTYKNGDSSKQDLYTFGDDYVSIENQGKLRPKHKTTFRYKNDLVVNAQEIMESTTTKHYHRNSKGYLDSITVVSEAANGFEKKRIISKEFFINNSYGDPVLHFVIEDGSTIETNRFRYEYDAKDNWIRRLTHTNSKRSANPFSEKFPDYYLSIRTIKYH